MIEAPRPDYGPPPPRLLRRGPRLLLLAAAGGIAALQFLALFTARPTPPYLQALPDLSPDRPLLRALLGALLGAVGLLALASVRHGRLAGRLVALAMATGTAMTGILLLVMAIQAGILDRGPMRHPWPLLWYGVLASLLLYLALIAVLLTHRLARRLAPAARIDRAFGLTPALAGVPTARPRLWPRWLRVGLLAVGGSVVVAQGLLLPGAALSGLALIGAIGWVALAGACREWQSAALVALCLADSLVVTMIVARRAGIAVELARSPLAAMRPPAPPAWQLWLGVDFPMLALPLLLAAALLVWLARRRGWPDLDGPG